jgi:hypothetical protein
MRNADAEKADDPAKQALHAALKEVRGGVLSRLDGLDDYDVRRPMTPSGTNLLGIVKHLIGVERGYLGECFGRPMAEPLPWYADGSVWDGADMWATAEESREDLLELYAESCAHADRTIEELDLDTVGSVPWWPEERRTTNLATLLVRMLEDTARHAGQADVVRESIDGRGGADHDSFGDEAAWAAYVDRIAAAAETFRR